MQVEWESAHSGVSSKGGVLDSKYKLNRIEEQGLNLGTGRELGAWLVIHAISQHDFLLIYFVYLVHPIYFHIHNIFYPY